MNLAGARRWGLPAVLLLFVLHLCLVPMEETDLFFRLLRGRLMLDNGALPRTNLFSFTHPTHPYLDSAWLFDLGAALLHRGGGFAAVVTGKALLVAVIFAVAHRFCRKRGAGALSATLVLAAAAWVMRERLTERPHLFSLLGVLLVADGLERRRPLYLVGVTAIWANLHAGAFLGPIMLLAGAAGGALDRRRGAGVAAPPALLALVGLGSGLALLATPVGSGIFQYLAFHLDINALHPIDEFRRPSWQWDAPYFLLALTTLGAVLLAATRTGEPPRLGRLLPVLAVALLFVRSVRFGAELGLLCALLLAPALSRLAARRLPRALPLGLAVALVGASVIPRARALSAGEPFVALGLSEHVVPVEALAFADRHGLRRRMYNDFELGSYLAFRDYPRHLVFVDPRLPAYPRDFHALLGRSTLSREAWDAALGGYDVDTALLVNAGINHRMGWWDPARWALVYRQGDARLFVRRLPHFAALIAAHEIPATFSFTPEAGTVTHPLPTPPPGSPVPPCEWQLRLGDLLFDLDDEDTRALAAYREGLRADAAAPGCLPPARAAAAHAWVGAAALTGGRPAEALAHLDAVRALGLAQAVDHVNRAIALEALGRAVEARRAWEQVAELTDDPGLARRARERAKATSSAP